MRTTATAPAQQPAARFASRVRPPQLWLRDVRFLTVVTVITVVLFLRPTDPDLWWHLKTGQLLVDGHRFFSTDPFSWMTGGHTWYLHEWLSEVLFYWLQANVSFALDEALAAAVLVATLAIVYRLALRIYPREIVVLALVFLSAFLIMEFAAVRPQVFSWLFFAIFFRQTYLYFRKEQALLWPLPLLMIFWSNMHLGYLFGLGLIWLFVAALLVRDGLPGIRSLRGPAAVALACTLVPAISPMGPRALLTPIAYAKSGQTALNVIAEWQSPNFHGPLAVPLLIAIVLMLVVGLPRGGRHLFGTALVLALTGLSLVAQRNVPFLAIVLPVTLAESAAERWPAPRRPVRMGKNALNWMIAGGFLVGIAAFCLSAGQVNSEPTTSSSLPSKGVAYVRTHSLGTRMLNSYNWGGYLISQLYPQVKVSLDGRSELYGDDVLSQQLDLLSAKPGWRDRLRAMNPDFALIPKDSPLAGELTREPGWKLVFEGPVEQIFVPAAQAK